MIATRAGNGQTLRAMIALLFAAGLIMAYQFSQPSFVSCFVDDSILHISWCTQFHEALREGQWIPRWLPLANGGYGSPVFIFYSPLVYYVTTFFAAIFPSVVTAMKVVKLVGLFLSGLSMYYFAEKSLGRQVAVAAGLLYQLLPYHVLDNYYWTFYAETWAWVWFPLILAFLLRCLQKPNCPIGYTGAALCYAGLILTHLVSAFMFAFIAVAFVIWHGRRSWRHWLPKLSLAGLACLGIVAYYVVPMLYEQRFVHIDQIVKLVDYNNTFVFFPNPVVHQHYRFFLNIILLLQWVTGGQVFLVCASWWIASGKGLHRLGKEGRRDYQTAIHSRVRTLDVPANPVTAGSSPVWQPVQGFFVVLAVSCVFLTTESSLWFWRLIPGFSQVQFPMRWLAFMTLSASCLAAVALGSNATGKSAVPVRGLRPLVLVAALFVCGLLSLTIIAKSCFLEEGANRLAFLHAYNATEYNPRWTQNPEKRLVLTEEPLFRLLSGRGEIQLDKWYSHHRALSYTAAEPLLLRLRLFDYPGWVAYLDGVPHSTQKQEGSGAIMIRLPPGRHRLEVRFEDTVWRRWSKIASLATLIGICLSWGFFRYGNGVWRPSSARLESSYPPIECRSVKKS